MAQREFKKGRLRIARGLNRWTLAEVAERTNLTRQSISQFEIGERTPSPETALKLAVACGVPPSFFYSDSGPLELSKRTPIQFRVRAATRSVNRERARGEAMLDLMAILTDKVEEWVHLPDSSMPDFTDRFSLSLADEQLEQLASDVRRAFGLGNGPISNVGALIENAGVIFSALPLPNGMDGQSTWQGGRAFVAIGADGTRARCRMDLAHEIGHLVLHKLVADEEMDDETYSTLEKQAWYFAGAFLMPAETFLREVYQTSLEGLLQLKPRWGVSLAAMIRRLKNLGVINESRYKSLQIELRARGWHKIEPQDEAQRERSRLLKGAVDFLCENGRIGLSDFAAGTSLPIWFLASALEASSAELVSVPTTNVVEFKPRQKPA